MTNQYLGVHMEPLVTNKQRKKHAAHPIFLYDSDDKNVEQMLTRLSQIVNIYEHTLDDFIINSKKIIKHYEKHYGDEGMQIFTVGQSISFRVHPKQEPFQLSLFQFLMNYTMLIGPVLLKCDLSDWKPFAPVHWTNGAWVKRMDEYIKMMAPFGNNRIIGEYLSWSKYLINLWCSKNGHRIGLSISNNDFIAIAERDKDSFESISCTFDIPKKTTPKEMEKIIKSRTEKLINYISTQEDLAISMYTRNNLFNPTQFQEFAVNQPHKPDLYGNTIPFRSRTNVMMGINDPLAHVIDAYGGRKAEIVKLNVSDAGAFERALCMLMSGVRFVDTEYECDSPYFRKKLIESADALDKLDGRVCTLDPDSDEYLVIDPDNVDLVGKLLYIKTPITCTHPRRKEGYICQACYGLKMAALNRDIHIGRVAALNLADDMEQKLLSAKHALATNTNEVQFDKEFDSYFVTDSCQIFFNPAMIELSADESEEFNHLYLEFPLSSMTKGQDGEGRHFDRSFPEIIVYDDRDDSRTVIKEENGIRIFLSQEFASDFFLPAIKHKGDKDIVYIPFSDLIDKGKVLCEVIFEYQYKNNDIPGALLELKNILEKSSRINSFEGYDDALDTLLPLFMKGGIHLPDLQTELLLSQLLFDDTGKRVDWSSDNVDYIFYTIDKAIFAGESPITSLLYQESSKQIAGAHDMYSKTGTSQYDYFIYDWK